MSVSPDSLATRIGSILAAAEPFLLWVFLSLLAIAWVGRRPYVALALALLGGVAMGLSSVASYPAAERERHGDAQEGPAVRNE
jgi:hypothetical protein